MKKYVVSLAIFSVFWASTVVTSRVSAQTELSAPGASSSIVISQFYGGGGNPGAVYNHDFVELYNRTSSPVSLSGWAIQYGSSGGTTWINTPMPAASIAPGGYFLVQFDTSGATGVNLPTPDYIAPLAQNQGFVANLSGTSGKLALTNSAATLPATACPSGSPIVDFVGYGTANCSETANAPATTNSTGGKRSGNGCTDTDNNSLDFTVGTPSARNSSSPTSPCSVATNPSGVGSATPNTGAIGVTTKMTVAVTPGSNPASTGIGVTADLSTLGGSATQAFFDDGTNGDITIGDNTFTLDYTIPAGSTGGIRTIPFTITDGQDRSSVGSFQFTVSGPSNPTGSGSSNPSSVLPGGSSTLTVFVTSGTQPASPITSVVANLSSIGGSSTQAFTDSGDNATFTFPATVSAGTPVGVKNLPFTITDGQARTGSGNIQLTVQSASDPTPHTKDEHELLGNPDGSSNTDNDHWLIERNQYVLSYNCSKGIPNWVEWHLDPSWIGTSSNGSAHADTAPPLPSSNCYIVQGSDYSGTAANGGFDRGHDCPSADRTNTQTDNDALFNMTNFIPQAPNNNQGPWSSMENYIRQTFIGTSSSPAGFEVYTWMGNAGQGGRGINGFASTVAGGKVVVPAYVWRVVMVLPTGTSDLSRIDTNTRVFAVLTPNIQSGDGLNANWMTYICPVSKIEQLTGLNFFPNVPASTASVLKQKIDPLLAAQTVGQANVTGGNLTLNYPLTYMTSDINVTGTLTLGPETLNTTNTAGNTNFKITLGPNATVDRTVGATNPGPLSSGQVTGTLEKQYTALTSFTYPVGTLNGYSPVTVNPTALGVNPSSLSVKAVQGPQPNANPQSTALKRYWTLTEAPGSDITANLTFNYLQGDVPAGVQESNLRLSKYEGFWSMPPANVDTNANTATTTVPISNFSDWTLLPLAATAADVDVAGRVLGSDGSPIRGARVTIDDGAGNRLTAISNPMGYYSFHGVPSGKPYIVSGSARGLVFTSRVVSIVDQMTDLDLTALP